MTLFTMLLVIIAERLFKLGEHWHLDHRLEVLFRRIKHFSMLRTLLMMAGVMVITFLLLRSLYGLFFNVPLLVVWISVGLKYSANPCRCFSVVAFSSHINRKNAIIAVTKSA